MKIAAVLGVKDEVEIVAASLAHLRAIGVDEIVVSDFGSTDGTLDVLATECRQGDVSLVRVDPAVVYDYATSSAHDAAQARRTDADWVLFLDADEFFIPATGRLDECRHLAEADVLVLDRYNVVSTASHLLMPRDLRPGHYDSLWLYTRQVEDFRGFLDASPGVPFIRIRPGPKVIARRQVADGVAPGGHDVVSDGRPVRRLASPDLIVAHVPFSTFDRFARKVANIRRERDLHPRLFDDGYAWHWIRWAEMTAPGALEREFADQIIDRVALPGLEQAGEARSAADLFAERLPGTPEARCGRAARWRDRLGLGRRDVPLWPVGLAAEASGSRA